MMLEVILATIGVSGIVVTGILSFLNVRRSNQIREIELEQALLKANQEEEARKRKEASEKHALDMQRVTAAEEKADGVARELDRLRGRFGVLWRFTLDLMTHINEGKGPPPPSIPPELLD